MVYVSRQSTNQLLVEGWLQQRLVLYKNYKFVYHVRTPYHFAIEDLAFREQSELEMISKTQAHVVLKLNHKEMNLSEESPLKIAV